MLGALFMKCYSYSMNSAPSTGKKQKEKTQTWDLKRRSKPTLNKLAFQPASQTNKQTNKKKKSPGQLWVSPLVITSPRSPSTILVLHPLPNVISSLSLSLSLNSTRFLNQNLYCSQHAWFFFFFPPRGFQKFPYFSLRTSFLLLNKFLTLHTSSPEIHLACTYNTFLGVPHKTHFIT